MDAAQEHRLRELEGRLAAAESFESVLTEVEAFELENLRTTRLLEATDSAPDNGEYLEHTIDYGYHPRPMSEEAELRFELAKAQRETAETSKAEKRCLRCGAPFGPDYRAMGGKRPPLRGWLLAWFRTGGKR